MQIKPLSKQKLRELSIQSVLNQARQNWGERNFVWEKINGKFKPKSFNQLATDTEGFAKYLLSQNMKGQQIAIFSNDSYNFMVADLAIMGYVGISVTLNNSWREKDALRAVKALDIKTFLYDDAHQDVAKKLMMQYPKMVFINIKDIHKLIKEGADNIKLPKIDTTKVSKIIFTSGTTGFPKAAMLSQRNMFAGGSGLVRRLNLSETEEVVYNLMPLCHVYGGIYNFLYSIIGGSQVYLCSDLANIPDELKEVKPTMFSVVPLVLERFYEKIPRKSRNKARFAMIFTNTLLFFGIDVRKKVFWQIHEAFGGQIKYLVSGGVKLDNKIKKFFRGAGIITLEGYGMTETASTLALEHAESCSLNSVGKVFEELDVKIDSPNSKGVGEIMVKGDNVFAGYYKNDAVNKQVFNGKYFKTGDLGKINKHGELIVYGRKKKTIVLSSGINIYPEEIAADLVGREIKKVHLFTKENQLLAKLFVEPSVNSEVIDELINEYNQQCLEYWRIADYEIINYDES